MKASYLRRSITLGFHPTSRGFGWAAFEGPFSVYDSGLFTCQRDKNPKCLRKVEKLLDRLQPDTLVLEAFDKRSSIRSTRIRRLCLSVVSMAAERGLEVAVYSRNDVRACFASVGARTRDEVAEAVSRHVQGLHHRLPKKRGAGDSEDKRLAMFCAAALVIAHCSSGSLETLKGILEGR